MMKTIPAKLSCEIRVNTTVQDDEINCKIREKFANWSILEHKDPTGLV